MNLVKHRSVQQPIKYQISMPASSCCSYTEWTFRI